MECGDLHLLVPTAPVGSAAVVAVFGTAVAAVRLDSSLGIASVLIAALIVIVAGVFTLRNNLKSFWKDLADERKEQVKVLEQHLAEKTDQLVTAQLAHTQEMAVFAEEQREIRHELRTEIANLEGRLKLEVAKTDLSTVRSLLEEIRDQLAAGPLTPERRKP